MAREGKRGPSWWYYQRNLAQPLEPPSQDVTSTQYYPTRSLACLVISKSSEEISAVKSLIAASDQYKVLILQDPQETWFYHSVLGPELQVYSLESQGRSKVTNLKRFKFPSTMRGINVQRLESQDTPATTARSFCALCWEFFWTNFFFSFRKVLSHVSDHVHGWKCMGAISEKALNLYLPT